MSTQVQYRRGTTVQNDAFTGALAEITVDTTNNTLRVHDGVTAGGFPVVGTTQSQTLTNKTLTAPTLSAPTVTGNITGNLVPAANLTYNLGSPTAYWGNLYLGGNTIYLGALQLKDTGTGTLGIYQNDGVTRANISVSEIVYGSTSFSILSAGGNAVFTVGGVSSVLSVTPQGVNVIGNALVSGDVDATGDINVIGNITVAHIETVTSVTASGNVSAGNLVTTGIVSASGNITGSYFIGNGSQLTGIDATAIQNGTANVRTFLNGNVAISSAGTANVVVVTATGANISGTLDATGNITGSYFIGNGSQLTGIDATAIQNGTANVRTFLNANVAISAAGASNVVIVTGTGSNITGTLDVTGNITGGNVSATNIAGTLTTAAQTNITSLGTLTSLTVNGLATHTGNIDVTGNINVTGNLNYTNVNDLVVGDPLVYFGANNTGNLYDLGFVVAWDDGVYQHGGVVRDASDGTWKVFGNVIPEPTTTVDFTNAIYQPFRSGFATFAGANINGALSGATTINASGNITGGNLITAGLASVTGNVTGGNIDTAGQVIATGNITGGNIITAGTMTASGNISGSYFIGNGSQLTGIDATAIQNGSANVRTFLNGNVAISAAGTANVLVVTSGGATLTGSITNGGANGAGNIGSSTGYFNTVFAKATSAQYADLAEMYVADADYEPGTVVSFGGTHEITKSRVDSDTRVAGVVSTNPSYLMNANCTGENTLPVALVGRVPTWVRGPVRKGDMMVSDGDGRARATSTPAIGTVIGKALEDFDGDIGVIEVVIGRL